MTVIDAPSAGGLEWWPVLAREERGAFVAQPAAATRPANMRDGNTRSGAATIPGADARTGSAAAQNVIGARPVDTTPVDATGSIADRVEVHVASLGRLLEPADALEGLGADQLRAHVAALRRLDGLTAAALARASRAAHRAGLTEADGASSTTEWLKSATGKGGRDANRLVRLGANLDDMPRNAAALARGEVPIESADALVQAARDGRLGTPDHVEDGLLDAARTSTPEELRAAIRRRQQHADGAALLADEHRQHARRRASLHRNDHTGMWDLHARLPDEVGSLVATAFDAFEHADARVRQPSCAARTHNGWPTHSQT